MKRFIFLLTLVVVWVVIFLQLDNTPVLFISNTEVYSDGFSTFKSLNNWTSNVVEKTNANVLRIDTEKKDLDENTKKTKVINKGWSNENMTEIISEREENLEKERLKIEENKEIQISFLWDVMIWSRVWDEINRKGLSFSFSWTQDFLSKKDMVVLNLENPVTNQPNIAVNKTYNFKADYKHLFWLKAFNKNLVVNLSNNHIWDYWVKGIWDTFANLEWFKIGYFWAGRNIEEANSMKIFEVSGLKIGFIWQSCVWPNSYKAWEDKAWSSFFDKDVIKNEIEKAREGWVDLVVYNMHCWDEYTNWPNWKQREYARFAIDSGADLVIWHHPHRYQGIENYKWKFIFYSLGDYIFDIERWRRTKDWIIANVIIKNKKIQKIEIIPTSIKWLWSTFLVTDDKYRKFILEEIYKISKSLWDLASIKLWYVE